MRRVFILLMIMFAYLSADAKVWNGTRTTDWYDDSQSYFEISTAEELAGLAELVSEGNNFYGRTIKLVADIVLNENVLDANGSLNYANACKEWMPIGLANAFDREYTAFSGTLDGGGHVIYGLYVIVSTNYPNINALFAGISEQGSVMDLGLEDGYLKNAGSICGINYGTIDRCYSRNTIILESRHFDSGQAGGICILNEMMGKISNCYFSGKISGSDMNGSIGGICEINNGQITGCYNSSTLEGNNSSLGGICHLNCNVITNCHNTGNLVGRGVAGISYYNNDGYIANCYNGADLRGDYVFGICGSIQSASVENCDNYGKIEAVGEFANGAGISGDLFNGSIINCVNEGEIVACDANSRISGICHSNRGEIQDCVNKGKLSAERPSSYVSGICDFNYGGIIANCHNMARINGTYEASGICSNNSESSGDVPKKGGVISDCSNIGDIEIIGASGNSTVGGICGWSFDSKNVIKNCYNRGNITIKNADIEDEYCNDRIGGICANVSGSVENCYNTGNITAREKIYFSSMDWIGGICGYFRDGNIRNCYNTGHIVGRKEMMPGGDNICYVGGISGDTQYGTIKSCCNFGMVEGLVGDIPRIGSISGVSYSSTSNIENCYYLRGTHEKAIGSGDLESETREIPEEEIVDVMNAIFTSDNGWTSSAYTSNGNIYLPMLASEEAPSLSLDGATANEEIATSLNDMGIKVYTDNNILVVETIRSERVSIVSMAGVVVRSEQQVGTKSYNLPQGIYIVTIGEASVKVRIR